MKKILILITLSNHTAFAEEIRYIAIRSGLILREKPSQQSARLTTIPYGAPIDVSETAQSSTVLNIDGFAGKFIPCKYSQFKGYVFSGFTTALRPPQKVETIEDYFADIFGRPKRTDKKVPSPDNPEIEYSLTYSSQAQIDVKGKYDSAESLTTFPPGATQQEVFLIMQALYPETSKWRFVLDKSSNFNMTTKSAEFPVTYVILTIDGRIKLWRAW